MNYKPAYLRAMRLAKLFCRLTGSHISSPSFHAVWECVWYRTAGIAREDQFKV